MKTRTKKTPEVIQIEERNEYQKPDDRPDSVLYPPFGKMKRPGLPAPQDSLSGLYVLIYAFMELSVHL